jgi:NADH-quinone oxidoreductase subunit L
MHGMEHGLHHADGHAPATTAGGPFAGTPVHQDMRAMGGLRTRMRATALTFCIGALALAGVFPLAGFWSKDEILYDVFVAPGAAAGVLFAVALLTAAITAYYAGRAALLTFFGRPRSAAAEHATESPPSMVVPLAILATLTVLGGLLALHSGEGTWLAARLGHSLAHAEGGREASKVLLAVVASAASLAGLSAAWLRHRRGWEGEGRALGAPARTLARAFYVDELYGLLFVRPFSRTATFLWQVIDDKVIDGAVNLVGRSTVAAAQLLRPWQTGFVRGYALSMLLGVAIIAVYLLLAVPK